MLIELCIATGETLWMVLISSLLAMCIGLPLGTWIFIHKTLHPNIVLAKILDTVVNMSRSVPFIILLVALIPLTRAIVGTSIGTQAAIVPLTLGAAPFVARLVENIYSRLPHGLIDAGQAMGATIFQMIRHILLPEAKPALIQAMTMTTITLVNYSAMAGTVGGGGLGDLAIRYGYQRFDVSIMLITIALLIIIVQIIQWTGDKFASYCSKGTLSCD